MDTRFFFFFTLQYVLFAWDYYCTLGGCSDQNVTCPLGDTCNVHCDYSSARCSNTKFIATHLVGGSFNLHASNANMQTYGAEVYCPKDGTCSVLCHEYHKEVPGSGACQGLTIYATNSTYLYVYAFGPYALNYVNIYCPDTYGFEESTASCVIEVESYNLNPYNLLQDMGIWNIEGLDHLNISCRYADNELFNNSQLDGCNTEGDYQSPTLHCGTTDSMSCRLTSDDGKIWYCATDSLCSSWEYPFVSLDPTYSPSNSITEYPSLNPSKYPSMYPSMYPSHFPSNHPSHYHYSSSIPSNYPSIYPSYNPSYNPSHNPSYNPSYLPPKYPSSFPSYYPSNYAGVFESSFANTVVTNVPSVYVSSVAPKDEMKSSDGNNAISIHIVISYIISGCLFILLLGICILMMNMRGVILKGSHHDVKVKDITHDHMYMNLSKIQVTTPTTPSTVSNQMDNKKSIDPEHMPELPDDHEANGSDDDQSNEKDVEDLYEKKENLNQDEGKQDGTLKTPIPYS